MPEPVTVDSFAPMSRQSVETDQEPAPAEEDEDAPSARTGRSRLLLHPGVVSVLVFLIGGPLAFALPRILPYGGGMGMRSIALPLAAGMVGAVIILLLALWRQPAWLAGATAGFVGAWFVLILSTAMRGTPFPMYGLLGDAGRLTAMATRYSVTAASADPWFRGLPSDYPPLFPWLVGRASALLDEPAWRLVGDGEVIFMGTTVVLGFVLWLRLVKPWTALAVTVLGMLTFAVVNKSYEVVTLVAFTPWVIGTFGNPPRGRIHWLPAGLAGAFIFLAYYGWLILGGVGLLAIAAVTWYRSENRRAYLAHVARVLAVILVLTSWFTVPYIYAKLTMGGATTGDLHGSSSFHHQMLPFLDLTWLGLLQLAGLIGLTWLRGRVWWAWPLLALVAGAYAFRFIGAVTFVLTNHTLISHYTPRLYSSVLAIAGVLTVLHAFPELVKRLGLSKPKGGAVLAMTVVLAWGGYTFTMDWMPGLNGRYSDYSERAYREPLPDGTYLAGFKNPTPWFPVGPIEREVGNVLGSEARPVTLSIDERLYSYLPWYGYLGGSTASNSTASVFDRLAELEKLARIKDPVAFTQMSGQTRFGEIDVFILKRETPQTWTWSFHRGYGQKPAILTFIPSQFSEADWEVVQLPEDVVMAVRKMH